MLNNELIRILLMAATTFLFVVIIMPIIKKIAVHINAMDIPDERKVHKKPMPRLGGLGIFLGFLLGYILFGTSSPLMNSILIGGFIIIITGIIDDIKPVPAKYKLIGQLLAALVIVFYGQLLIKDISAFGIYLNFSFFSYPLTIFFILGCINCINIIDGLDGLSGGISAIYFLTIGIISIMKGSLGLEVVLSFVMLGSTLGFLVYNFNPASIFAGDSGSMFMGFIISVIALLGFKNVTLTSLIIPLLLLAIPIIDTLCAIIRRRLKGEKIGTPDKLHFHHQLLKKNLSQKEAVLTIYLVDLLFAFTSIIYLLKDRVLGYILYGILFLAVLFFVLTTSIIFENKDGLNVIQRIIKKIKDKKNRQWRFFNKIIYLHLKISVL